MTVGFAAWLLPPTGTGVPSWLAPAVVVVGLAAAAMLAAAAWAAHRRDSQARGSEPPLGGLGTLGGILGVAAVLLVPAVASGSVVALGLGAFDTPFQPVRVTEATRAVFAPPSSPPGLAEIERVRRGAPYLFAAQTSAVAAPYIYVTGEEVLPLGGYTGTAPVPSARAVASSVLEQKFHLALVASPGASPGARYVYDHCVHVPQPKSQPTPALTPKFRIYYCQP